MIRLKDYIKFKRKQIGYELEFCSETHSGRVRISPKENIYDFFIFEDDEILLSRHSINDLEKALKRLGEIQEDEANSDEILRAMGYYDSTDNRSCCRKKRE